MKPMTFDKDPSDMSETEIISELLEIKEHIKAWIDGVQNAIYAVHVDWHNFTHSTDPLEQARWLIELSNRMSDLITWHEGFDYETGEIHENS